MRNLFRIVYDAVTLLGGPTKVEINRAMMKDVRFSSQKYKRALAEKKEKQTAAEKNRGIKRKLELELKELENKKKKSSLEKEEEIAVIDKDARALKARIESLQ